MGEENDEQRPGFDYFVTHKGQGKYFDTEFNVDGEREGRAGLLHARRHRPGRSTGFEAAARRQAVPADARPQGAAQLLHPGAEVRARVRRRDDRSIPQSAFQLDDKPEWFKTRLDTWHGIYGPLFEFRKKFPDRQPGGGEGLRRDDARPTGARSCSVDDSVGRLYAALKEPGQLDNTSSSSRATTACSTASTAWSISGRCTSRASACRSSCATPA